ncbi:MAG: hypothetical protein ACXVPN_15175 [Bacteroidia bacterium]
MKTQIQNIKTPTTIQLLLLITVAILLLLTSCKKESLSVKQNTNTQLSETEQNLLGKWQLTKNEIYEIDGVDSVGQYICSLISTENCDSVCGLQFKSGFIPQIHALQLTGFGSIGACDSINQFSWNANQQNVLEISSANKYNILYLTDDSAAFSRVYIKDILQLKSVAYYKRSK